MKKYRPSTKQVMIGLILMILGVICWCIVATFNNSHLFFLFPVGLILVCVGGLELTITALITLHKNDLATREMLKKREEEKKKAEAKQ